MLEFSRSITSLFIRDRMKAVTRRRESSDIVNAACHRSNGFSFSFFFFFFFPRAAMSALFPLNTRHITQGARQIYLQNSHV